MCGSVGFADGEGEGAAFALYGFDPDATFVGFDGEFAKGETQARARGVARLVVAAVEFFKDVGDDRRGDAFAVVANRDDGLAVAVALRSEADFAALAGVVEGVGYEVINDAAEELFVAVDL